VKFYSQVYSAVSGSIGGITYAHNQGGMYARGRAIPTNPNTVQQQALRNAVGQLTTAWSQTLTQANRDAWATFAANVPILDVLGVPRTIPALSWYVKANSLRLQSGLSRIDAGPVVFELATLSLPVITLTPAAGTASMAFTNTDAWANEVGGALLVYASRAQQNTINFFNGPYQYAGRVNGAGTPPTSPATITLPFVTGPAGSKQFFRVVAVRADGRPSSPFRIFDIA